MRNILKEFVFPSDVRALPPADDRTPLIFQIVSNLFNEDMLLYYTTAQRPPGGDITNLTGIDANEVEIVVEHEDYENAQGEPRTRARVAWVNNPGAFGISEEQKLTGAKLSSFAAKMKGQLLAAAKKTSSPNGAAPKSKSPPDDFNYGSADDIPF